MRLVRGMRISGPGRVRLGERVYCDGSMHRVDLPTYDADAVIEIGHRCYLNGTRLGCARGISIGDDCILADCRIMDTNFHSVYPGRRTDEKLVRKAPIVIGDDCWICAGAYILPGTRIGAGSTVAAGAVVMGRFPERSLIAGNPARVIMRLGAPPGE